MALPPTGSTITMSQIRNYFVTRFPSSYTMSVLGTYIGITATEPVNMSSSFGGYYFPIIE